MPIIHRGKLIYCKHVLFVCVFLTFLVYSFNNKENIQSHTTEEKMILNSTLKFKPNRLNRAYKIGILVLCNYNENKEELSSILSKLSDQCIPSIYRTMEGEYKYKIYIGVNERLQRHVASMCAKCSVITLDDEAYSDGINSLATKALSDQMEYFVVLSYDTVLTLNFWTSQAIYSLKGHCPSDFGTVFHYCCEINTTTVVQRTHIILSGSLFPPGLNITESVKWLYEYYYSNYISVIPFNVELKSSHLIKKQMLYLERADTNLKNRLQIDKRPCVISYSLYGSDPRYTTGALENTYLSKMIYPGWHVWIYYDKSVPKLLLNVICNQPYMKCIDMSSSIIKNRRSWRFLVASEKNVSHYIIRDIDSRLSFREKVAVNEWILSGKKLHTMRDHPNQGYFINAGMWGGRSDTYPHMEVALHTQNLKETYTGDSDFLTKVVWPFAKFSVMQHDSVCCLKFGGVPFPTSRIGYEHVGSVYINDVMRQSDVNVLKKFKIPNKCDT